MKTWEYRQIETCNTMFEAVKSRNPRDVLAEINAAGKEGFRLLPIGLNDVHRVFIMEREIPEPPADEQPEAA